MKNFKYPSLQRLSPPINNFVVENNIEPFDFDGAYYYFDRCQLLTNEINLELWDYFSTVAKTTSKILVMQEHPFFSVDTALLDNQLVEITNKLNLKLHWLTADYTHWDNLLTDRCFWPLWYFELRSHANKHNIKDFNWSTTRKYNFSCNNAHHYRLERIYNLIECFKRDRKDWIINLYNKPGHLDTINYSIDLGKQHGILTQEHVDIWNHRVVPTIRTYSYDLKEQESPSSLSVLFPGHTDAYCNLVVEHSMEIEILSEKSFKPFVAKQIPIYLAKAGACEMLTKLGFDLFYDFVDHNKYDTIGKGVMMRFPDCVYHKQIDEVHQLIDQLYSTEFLNFINHPSVLERLEKNHEHFYSTAIDTMCVERLAKLYGC
jgi:hypothetical protein